MKEDGSLHHSLQENNLALWNANPEPEELKISSANANPEHEALTNKCELVKAN